MKQKFSKNLELAISSLSLREKIGQLIMLDFRFWGKDSDGKLIPFTEPSKEVLKIISQHSIGGLALFRENCASPAQMVKLINSIQSSVKIPLLIGIDQEGGIVTRLQSGTDTPGNMALCAANSARLVKKSAELIGKELSVLGVNLNFAPVVDVNSNQNNPVIGVRSFGSYHRAVAKMGRAYIKGLAKNSIMSCAKHFPGHGNTNTDTHLSLAVIKEFKRSDLIPFQKLIDSGVDTIMTSHVMAPDLDNGKEKSTKDGSLIGRPSSLSHKILTKLLREKMKFKGVLLTDALDMKAISDHFGQEEACIKTIISGADMAVMPVTIRSSDDIYLLDSLFKKLIKEYRKNRVFAKRVEESLQRVFELKDGYKLLKKYTTSTGLKKQIRKAQTIVGCEEHKKIEKKIALKTLTLLKNEDNILPFSLFEKCKILVIGYSKSATEAFCETLNEISRDKIVIKKEVIDQQGELTDKIKDEILSSDFITLLTYNLNDQTSLPGEIVKFANSETKKLMAIGCRNPYDIAYMEEVKAYMAIYGAPGFDQTNQLLAKFVLNLQTAPHSIFTPIGKTVPSIIPKGKLPVSILSADGSKTLFPRNYSITYTKESGKL